MYSFLRSRRGFSLVELLLFSAIFAIVIVSFIGILVTVLSIQAQQAATAEVTTQSGFLLQQIESLVERSSLIEMPQDVATTTLKLRMPSPAEDPTILTLVGSSIIITQGNQTPGALTSNKVIVSGLAFTKHSNAPSHDSVSVSFTVSNNSPSIKQKFVETLSTAVARVSAATFDSNVIPSSTAVYDLGVAAQIWRSVNNILYFSGSNVGIGTATPLSKLDVNGGLAVGTYAGTSAAPANGLIVSGNVGIGTASPLGLLSLNQSGGVSSNGIVYSYLGHQWGTYQAGDNTYHFDYDSVNKGYITTAGAYTQVSDINLKENIKPIATPLHKLLSLQGVYFTWKGDALEKQNVGFIAQNVQTVLPEVVSNSGGELGVSYGNVVPLVVEAVKELNAKVDALRVSAPHGITTQDVITGESYCMAVVNGVVQALMGACR